VVNNLGVDCDVRVRNVGGGVESDARVVKAWAAASALDGSIAVFDL